MTTSEAIDAIARESSSNNKKFIIRENVDDVIFRRVLFYALNPHYTYGVVKIPDVTLSGSNEFSEQTFELLDLLRHRDYTGNKAIQCVIEHMQTLTQPYQRLFKCILDKDLRAGISRKTVNAVIPKFIPSFEIMLAEEYDESRLIFPCLAERKMDGVRCMIRVGHDIEFFSRAGKPFHCFEHMKDELRSQFHSEVFLDGEMISSSFNKVVSSVHRKNYSFTDGIFSVFDILTPQTRNMTLSDRRKVLETIKENDHLVVTPQQVMYSVEDISEFYAECLQNGYEGVIIKDPHSLYEDRRSFSWMKIKPKATVDVSIIGTYEGTGKNLGRLGGFFCSTDGSEEVHRVGSGFTDEQRIEFWEASLTGRIIEIEVQEKLTTGGFRHSRFKRFRDTLTQCKE